MVAMLSTPVALLAVSSASEVGHDAEQVEAERKGEKSPSGKCHRRNNNTKWLKWRLRLPGAGL